MNGNSKSGFGALLDFKFESFLALKMIRTLYMLAFACTVSLAGMVLLGAMTQGTKVAFAALVAVPIVFLIIMMFTRIILEVLAVIFRVAEDARAIRDRGSDRESA